ncbi:diaminopimelate epimerase [Nibricoccus sp. IMCC34717]|uniref:diaminopimelate epimerase n=1 Tax=Nibricoccus sp. IMCC34717 TaxID=3034021 RepID=UPI00384DED20
MRFVKYHGLGNDYLVLDPADFPEWRDGPSVDQIVRLCHRNFGVGSDGILWGPLPSDRADSRLRILNPDGSEAEKSGNGVRIFARYLWDTKRVGQSFTLDTLGGVVRATVHGNGGQLTIDMGNVSFRKDRIPVELPESPDEVLNQPITIQGRAFTFSAATIGNPHCVLPVSAATPELARTYGPDLEIHPYFPRKTNVQFLEVLDRANIRIEIWERGAGYTLASGSSSSAAAAVAHRLGLVDDRVTVHMPGGTLAIEIGTGYAIRMTGPVVRICEGTIDAACLR